jgi:predicted transposase/invertase (TIGR01784 family)
MGLINAILERQRPIDTVEIRNPFSYQEFAESKAIVLDVRCRDTLGRWLNVEMQISVYPGLLERLVYYACSMYVNSQLQGQRRIELTPIKCLSLRGCEFIKRRQ